MNVNPALLGTDSSKVSLQSLGCLGMDSTSSARK
jgi:hypothetical protein